MTNVGSEYFRFLDIQAKVNALAVKIVEEAVVTRSGATVVPSLLIEDLTIALAELYNFKTTDNQTPADVLNYQPTEEG